MPKKTHGQMIVMNRKLLNLGVLGGAGIVLLFAIMIPLTENVIVMNQTALGPGQTYTAQEIAIPKLATDFEFYVNSPNNLSFQAYILPAHIDIEDVLTYLNYNLGTLEYYATGAGSTHFVFTLDKVETTTITVIILNFDSTTDQWNNQTTLLEWGGSYSIARDVTTTTTKYVLIGVAGLLFFFGVIGISAKENIDAGTLSQTTKV